MSMKKEIRSIDGKQTAKVVAITGALFSLIFTLVGVILFLIGLIDDNEFMKLGALSYILMPLWYLILVYIFSRLVYWLYNKVAARVGGAVIEMEDK